MPSGGSVAGSSASPEHRLCRRRLGRCRIHDLIKRRQAAPHAPQNSTYAGGATAYAARPTRATDAIERAFHRLKSTTAIMPATTERSLFSSSAFISPPHCGYRYEPHNWRLALPSDAPSVTIGLVSQLDGRAAMR
ncbi:hypothetical protein SPHINGOAX6_70610 [Sphingomonas sp. AX6]|nr:hypothetical protein SPHINGOAX6_70610 [Sphingomonas sp. AX6]